MAESLRRKALLKLFVESAANDQATYSE